MTGLSGRKGRTARVAVLALAFAGGAVLGGEAQDRLFALGALEDVATGETLVYDFARQGDYADSRLGKSARSEARLTVNASGEGGARQALAVVRDGDEVIGGFDPFPADAGNPMFMVFMEESVTAMASLTGGSSFYIRNRMREALGSQDSVRDVSVAYEGREVPARELTFQPFLRDKNAEKMGSAFAGLTITFVMSDEIPGGFARMEAVTAPGSLPGQAPPPEGTPLMDLTVSFAGIEEG